MEFNSLSQVKIEQHPIVSLRNNNYWNPNNTTLYNASFDELPYFHDPLYDSTAGYWKAHNLLLTGKSSLLADHGVLDIDSVPRLLPDASAANTICVSADEFPDTLKLDCGERIALRLCPGQEQFALYPLPWNGSIDMAALPLGQGMYVFLVDATGSHLDSCWVYRGPYPEMNTVQLYSYCGFPVEVHALYPLFADSMRWEPAWLFEYPNQPLQTVQSDTTVLLTANVFSAICGTLQQSFQLNVAEVPYAYFTEVVDLNTVHFDAWSSCCDSIRWELGDGTSSDDDSLTHVYASNGSFLVTLTCWLQGDSGVTYTYVSIQGVGVEEHEPIAVAAYPNPASNLVHITDGPYGSVIRIRLMDSLGRLVLERNGVMPILLDVGHLTGGRYLLRLEHSSRHSTIPLIIQRE